MPLLDLDIQVEVADGRCEYSGQQPLSILVLLHAQHIPDLPFLAQYPHQALIKCLDYLELRRHRIELHTQGGEMIRGVTSKRACCVPFAFADFAQIAQSIINIFATVQSLHRGSLQVGASHQWMIVSSRLIRLSMVSCQMRHELFTCTCPPLSLRFGWWIEWGHPPFQGQ